MSILGSIVKSNTDISDEVIINNMMASAAGAANAYLNATLTSPTAELRAIYSASLSQVIASHTALTALSIKRGWDKPYNPPTQQLSEVYLNAKSKITKDK